MKQIILFFIAILLSLSVLGKIVPEKQAEKVAKNYFYQVINSLKNTEKTEWGDIVLNCIVSPEKDKITNYYIFNVNGNNGFVLISSNYSITPVLAYSFEAGFNFDNIAPGQQLFLDYYSESIKYAFENNLEQDKRTSDKWEYYLNYNPKQNFKQKTIVEPLLGPIKWNQSWPYNAMCPPKTDGMGGNVPVGCSATSMLQMMKYYSYPDSGTGAYTHVSSENGGHEDYYVNFAQETYDWSRIPAKASSNYNEELARINLHAGVAIKMYWTNSGSGASTQNVVYAMKEYFKYSPEILMIKKEDYNETNWKDILRNQIDNKMPMIYVGYSTAVGHAWNCDGYQGDEHFHMNWGWGGSGNGYYTLENLNSTATPGGDENNFNLFQRAVIDIYPGEEYPEFCSGVKIITGEEGSFDDGSSNSNYLPNTNCIYVINPECGAVINLTFNRFNLAEGDVLEVFDGNLLLETFNGNNIPENDITIYNNHAKIHFITDENDTDYGWDLSYSVTYCKMNIKHTENSGSINDGSGNCEYKKSKVCTWHIEPENVNFITIEFEEFDLAGVADFVKIFKNSIHSSNNIAFFTADNPPDEAVYVDSDVAIIQFFADSGESGQGWKLNYESGITNVEEDIFVTDLSIVPNPGNNNSNILIKSEKNLNADFSVYNITGELIGSRSTKLIAGNNSIKISDILSQKLDAGAYYIVIETDNNMISEKFIVLE